MKILLTGATGYVGGRLLKRLESEKVAVRCLVRQVKKLQGRVGPLTELIEGDLLSCEAVEKAMEGTDIAFYLVHSMNEGKGFEEVEKKSALTFAHAARKSGIRKIIYLGGICHDAELSAHLKSRQIVGETLRQSDVPTIEFQASIIIGSGSLSFEMIRALMERLPVMTTPKWVNVLAQPIFIQDVIQYLFEAIEYPTRESLVFQIGGPDKLSYLGLMKAYSRARGLKRLIIQVPILSPGLSSLWLGLVTPLYARVGRKLIDSIRHETTVLDRKAESVFSVKPTAIAPAIKQVLMEEDQEFTPLRFSQMLPESNQVIWNGRRYHNRLIDTKQCMVRADCKTVFNLISRIGGKNGWYFANSLWQLRGAIDNLLGGVGMKRGRNDAGELKQGDVIDCWKVESYESDKHLRLAAEMKLPGRAWLDFEVKEAPDGCCLIQTAMFDPLGLSGLAYWYLVWPLHQIIFRGMLQSIARLAMGVK